MQVFTSRLTLKTHSTKNNETDIQLDVCVVVQLTLSFIL